MKLRYSATSPYVRKVSVCAIEIGLNDRIEQIPTAVWDSATDIGTVNPLGKVPALVTDEGLVLFDSPVICEYLDSLHDGVKLFPEAPARWTALRFQAIADGIFDAAILRLVEGKRDEALQSLDWMARQKAVVDRALASLETDVAELSGPLTIGGLSVGIALGYLDFRYADENWRHHCPALADWYEVISERPSMLATVPKDPT